MNSDSSVTHWITAVKTGDEDAAARIWQRFFPKLVELARSRMKRGARKVYDEEDAALSAFHRFFTDARAGQFPKLNDRHDLWQILTVLTMRKIIDTRRAESAAKRGGGRVQIESELDEQHFGAGLDNLTDPEPNHEFVAELIDQAHFVLDRIDAGLREIAVLKMKGFTTAEIAERVGLTSRSVERKVERVRRQWQEIL